MKNNKFIITALLLPLACLFLSFWSCSSSPQPSLQPEKEASPATPTPEQKEQAASKKPSDESATTSSLEKETTASAEAISSTENKSGRSQDEKQAKEDATAASLQEDTPVKDPATCLELAWQAYQDAQTAWDKGDLDTALLALDEAYSLLLKADLPPDSPLIQDKNDLRLLISRRIQEIYASRISAVIDNHRSIPLEENKYVLAEIKNFQTKERKYFEAAYRRSGRYRHLILEELRREGLPEQLSWLPLIESGFKVNAYSRARALGLWQFISSTGYRFGLKRDRWVDERMDFIKSTRAAVQYLKELHSFFGDWTTALAAYNCGEFRVQKVIQAQRINYLDNFWDLYIMLPRETARFVPRFIATLLIINNPEKYGFNLPQPDPPLEFEVIEINKPVKLSTLAKNIGVASKTLEELNPELRHKSTPDQPYSLRVPPGYGQKVLAVLDNVSRWIPPEATYVIHYVRRGETLSTIARRYRTSISAIARLNRLRSVHLIRPGQRLKIPSRVRYTARRAASMNLIKEGEKLVYIVQRGDSLYRIASAFNTSVARIKQMNNLKSNILRVGQKLIIQQGLPEGARVYVVQRGDTPYKIAQKFGMSLELLLKLNGLSRRSKIYPGQKLYVQSNN
ncbi:LysM peptidoglycan-binding domain-containing protein [Candidatus Aminicenantes bacterium AC-334-K16]|nr:LysM peptidoglycan-binding domain-containing protein [Candidatus Aminicenantes bacterium AC-334-K16]